MSIIASICACGAGSSSINPESVCGLICAMIVLFLSMLMLFCSLTKFLQNSKICVGVDAHIDPMAIADSHWIFVKTAHTAGAMCSIAPYEHPGRVCPYPGGISQIKRILPSRALGREYRNTSWCHPNLKSLLFLVCRALGAATGDFGTSLIRPLGGCPSRTLAAEIFQLAISSLSGRHAVLLPRPCGSALFR